MAKFFYGTNTPFIRSEHPEFKKVCEVLRPGYKPPTAKMLAGPLLDATYLSVLESCQAGFQGETVTMGLDGWSNVRNEPIVCFTIVNANGKSALVSTVDTSGNSHTAEYLQELAMEEIKKCEKEFKVRIGAFVTDNTGNVTKMRRQLADNEDMDIIQFGCNAHILNLLAKDVKIEGVSGPIVQVIKYFRNTHLPAAWYKSMKGTKLVLPCEVRWNTMSKAIESFLKNRGILVQICQDHKSEIDKNIATIVNNANLVMNAQDYSSRMRPIAVALDRMQRDKTTIAVAVEVWFMLGKALEGHPKKVEENFEKRRNMALGGPHFLANMADHRFRGVHLTSQQKSSAYEYLKTVNPDFLPLLLTHVAGSDPFPKNMYGPEFREVSPMVWWKSITFEDPDCLKWGRLKDQWMKVLDQLFSAVPNTAAVERTFSSFGLVHSKLRNRLGVEKAGKLTFMFKQLNESKTKKAINWEKWSEEKEGEEEKEEDDEEKEDADGEDELD